MKEIMKEIFGSKNIKKAMIGMLLAQPNHSGSYYLELNNLVRNIENANNEEIEISKAS
ncbi:MULTISPECIES: hypothetical protein [Clostridium]|uniref:Uncharacterized protein n=1 Tax=Clostridium frigoriphilum TaxID=443253 RepID=A0ABU7UTI7_9CLOT|nr:hypothetical protein [Clostridium sp. DSM 17811]MBU3101128.1 hypothetical protein [Clostridium sp. DSM 17811]